MKRFYHWYPHAGYGGRFHQWAQTTNSKPYHSWGNGAAMHISPAGYAYDDLETVLEKAKEFTGIETGFCWKELLEKSTINERGNAAPSFFAVFAPHLNSSHTPHRLRIGTIEHQSCRSVRVVLILLCIFVTYVCIFGRLASWVVIYNSIRIARPQRLFAFLSVSNRHVCQAWRLPEK